MLEEFSKMLDGFSKMLDEFSKMLDGFSKIASCRLRSTSVDICRQSENRRFFDVFLRF